MLADAGVVYDVAIRPVDPSNLAVSAPESSSVGAVVTHYFVQDGRVRVRWTEREDHLRIQ